MILSKSTHKVCRLRAVPMAFKSNTLSTWSLTWRRDPLKYTVDTVQQAYPNIYDASTAFHALSPDFTRQWRLDQHFSLPH